MSYGKRVSQSHDIKKPAGRYLRGLVLRCSNEVCPISRPLEIRNGHVWLVNLGVVKLLSSLALLADVPQCQSRAAVPSHHIGRQSRPHGRQ